MIRAMIHRSVSTNASMPISGAYRKVKKQLQDICNSYKLLDECGQIGKQLGLYRKDGDRLVPGEDIKEYLRGGIISSFAAFEEFQHNILFDTACEINESSVTRQELDKLIKKHPLNNPRWTTFKNVFQKVVLAVVKYDLHGQTGVNNLDLLLTERNAAISDAEHCQFSFCYPLARDCFANISFEKETDIENMLDLMYGLRCIIAHGAVSKTLSKTGVLKKFVDHCNIHRSVLTGYQFAQFLHESLPKAESTDAQLFNKIPSIPGLALLQQNVLPEKKEQIERFFKNLDIPFEPYEHGSWLRLLPHWSGCIFHMYPSTRHVHHLSNAGQNQSVSSHAVLPYTTINT